MSVFWTEPVFPSHHFLESIWASVDCETELSMCEDPLLLSAFVMKALNQSMRRHLGVMV